MPHNIHICQNISYLLEVQEKNHYIAHRRKAYKILEGLFPEVGRICYALYNNKCLPKY